MATSVYMITDWDQLTPELAKYRLGIVNMAIDYKKLKEVAPNLIPFASFDMTMLSQAGPNNSMYQSLRSAMDPHILRDASGAPVLNHEYAYPYFNFADLDGAYQYAGWMRKMLPDKNKYLDSCTEALPKHMYQDMPFEQRQEQIRAFPNWRDRVISLLIQSSEDPAVIINSAGWICAKVNGITIEKSHKDRMGWVIALGSYATQFTIGRHPTYSVDWEGSWEFPIIGLYRGVTLPGYE